MSILTVKQAAEINGTEISAIYQAIRKKRLRATRGKQRGQVQIDAQDLYEYISSKHDHHETPNGRVLFNKRKGFYSVAECAEYLNITKNAVYYAIRMKRMKAKKIRYSFVVSIEELDRFRNSVVE